MIKLFIYIHVYSAIVVYCIIYFEYLKRHDIAEILLKLALNTNQYLNDRN